MDAKPTAPINRAAAYAIAALGICLAAFSVIGSLQNFGKVNDLPQYYAAADMLMNGHAASIYDFRALFQREFQLFPSLARGIGLFLPPPAVLILAPLVLLPAAAAPLVWTVLLVVATGLSLALLSRHFKLSKDSVLWLIGMSLLSGPVVESLRLGQLAPLMLLAVTLFLIGARKYAGAGLYLLFLLLKPQQLLPILVCCCGAFRKRLMATTFAGIILLAAASWFIFGQSAMQSYIHAVMDPANLDLMQPQLNPTVRGQMMRIFGPTAAIVSWIAAASLLAAVCLIALIGYRNRANDNWLGLCFMVALPLGLVTSLHCHDYDLVLLIPGLVQLTRTQLWHKMSAWKKTAIGVGMGLFLLPFYTDIHYGYLLNSGLLNPYFFLLLIFSIYLVTVAIRQPGLFDENPPQH